MPLTNFRYTISMSTLDGRALDNDEQMAQVTPGARRHARLLPFAGNSHRPRARLRSHRSNRSAAGRRGQRNCCCDGCGQDYRPSGTSSRWEPAWDKVVPPPVGLWSVSRATCTTSGRAGGAPHRLSCARAVSSGLHDHQRASRQQPSRRSNRFGLLSPASIPTYPSSAYGRWSSWHRTLLHSRASTYCS